MPALGRARVALVAVVSIATAAMAGSPLPTSHEQAEAGAQQAIAPLLPDGALLKRALGQVTEDSASGSVHLQLRRSSLGEGGQDFLLMPCALTRELVELQQREGSDRLLEVSGVITAYRARNWLLPAAASLGPLQSELPAEGPAIPPGAPRPAAPAPTPAPSPRHPADGGDPGSTGPADAAPMEIVPLSPETIADQLDAMLDDAAKGVARSADPGEATVAPADPRAEEHGAAPAAPTAPAAAARVMARPTRLQDKRVAFVRDERSGAWRAVFASPTRAMPSSAEILPCQRLESIEQGARRAEPGTPFLVSGVLTHGTDGRWYLLPTVVRPLRAGKWIAP